MAIKNDYDTDVIKEKLEGWLENKITSAGGLRINNINIPQASGLSAVTIIFDASWIENGVEVTRNLVARAIPREEGIFQTADLIREFELFQALNDLSNVPIPAPFKIETNDDSVLGMPFFVMEAVPGLVASDDPPYTAEGWVMDLNDKQREILADNSLQALLKIQDVDYQSLGLDWLDDGAMGAPDIEKKLDAWKDFYDWCRNGQKIQLIDDALSWLYEHKPSTESETVISWGDARLGNMIINEDLSVAAVIDWEMVGLGCREIDLAWWIFTRRFHTQAVDIPLPGGFPSDEAIIQRYTELTSHKPKNLDYYIIFAGLRLSIIFFRIANLMIDHGLLPEDSVMASNNPAIKLLAVSMKRDVPEGEAIDFVGNRS
ncbi:Predicted kinase, aminoglycoside phosphotransferase (APT) family [Marinobacter sp. es.048]|uniref:phosphotransferase family protein n=1 Tax=Marinobacter sp. es.048 TaxID=1761795 RepID=UPI000B58F1B7|nr:phosphotransferase family protein [Marinobacter sp. es.048]SNC62653.1 Predicted kinase, aminoglycoside phosphotransferase (APT) family [Marinobacter sp. es.048]